ncbi:MAG: GntR family transcriptional regulator [Erysipelotrichaceae bacterium]|jgi:GntR family transcriptional regulator|nr:GntR family transcriptional regulator [Erysipelotrichaceae bacterium]
MNIIISNSSDKPIYEQITIQIKNLIMNDSLKEGDALPSMRVLAKELRISLITTKRAYEELERDGFIETVMGKGSFVAGRNKELIREESCRQMEELLGKAVDIAAANDISEEEMIEVLTLLYKERY